jgi:hypothetical protein
MSFRYRILFYHENQKWVHRIIPLLEIPLFHLHQTDSEAVAQKKLQAGEVDIIVTGLNTQHFLLTTEGDSMGFKKAYLWEIVERQKNNCQVILLCTHQELSIATDLVERGRVADYFVVDPILDRNRLFITLMRTLENSLMRELLHKTILRDHKLPSHLLESIEALKEVVKNAHTIESTYSPGKAIEKKKVVIADDASGDSQVSLTFGDSPDEADVDTEEVTVELDSDIPTFPSFPVPDTDNQDEPEDSDVHTFPSFPTPGKASDDTESDIPTFPSFPTGAKDEMDSDFPKFPSFPSK